MLATVEYEHDPEYAEYIKRVDTAAALGSCSTAATPATAMGQGASPSRGQRPALRNHQPALQRPPRDCGSACQPAHRYIKPARDLCMRNLRDPILICAEQLGG